MEVFQNYLEEFFACFPFFPVVESVLGRCDITWMAVSRVSTIVRYFIFIRSFWLDVRFHEDGGSLCLASAEWAFQFSSVIWRMRWSVCLWGIGCVAQVILFSVF